MRLPFFKPSCRERSRRLTDFDESDQCVLRRTMSDYYAREETRTVEKFLREMKDNMEFGVLLRKRNRDHMKNGHAKLGQGDPFSGWLSPHE